MIFPQLTQPAKPQVTGPAQSSEQYTPQHRYLLAKHQQLGVLGGRRACEQHHPADYADKGQIHHPYRHEPAILPATPPSRQACSQVSRLCPFWTPTPYLTARDAGSGSAFRTRSRLDVVEAQAARRLAADGKFASADPVVR